MSTRHSTHHSILAALTLSLAAPSTLALTLVESRFDSDADGWTALTLNSASGSWNVQNSGLAVQYTAADGVPPGSISFQDPDDGWSYFSAPAKFLGDQSAALGGAVVFHTRTVDSTGALGASNEADVVLRGAGLTLVADPMYFPPATWTQVSLSLTEGTWRVSDTFTGAFASQAQIAAVLGALQALWINAEHFIPAVETIGLDNVLLTSPIPEPSVLAMLLFGLGTLALPQACRRRIPLFPRCEARPSGGAA